jgi:hypothetical protein
VAKPEGKMSFRKTRPNSENNINIGLKYEGVWALLIWLGTGINVAFVKKDVKI